MRRPALPLVLVTFALAGCVLEWNRTWPDAAADLAADSAVDAPADSAVDFAADSAADFPADSAVDSPAADSAPLADWGPDAWLDQGADTTPDDCGSCQPDAAPLDMTPDTHPDLPADGAADAFVGCGPGNCSGCCSGPACLPGDSDNACGTGGQPCNVCTATCVGGTCTLGSGWAVAAGGAYEDHAYDIAVDSAGNSYITGYFSTSASFGTYNVAGSLHEAFVAKLDPNGTFLWPAVTLTVGTPATNKTGWGIAVDAGGNVYVTGDYAGKVDFQGHTVTSKGQSDVFVAKLDSTGKFLWAASGGGSGTDVGRSIAVDGGGSCVVSGSFEGTADFGSTSLVSQWNEDLFVAKLDASGKFLWAKSAGGAQDDNAFGVAIDSAGNSLVAGRFFAPATFPGGASPPSQGYDAFVMKLDPSGNLLWVTPGGSASHDYANDVAVDQAGNVTIVGFFQETATFGTKSVTSAGNLDVYVAKLDANGTFLWATAAGGTGHDEATAVALDGAGNAFVTGSFFSSPALFGTTALGTPGLFLAKLDANGAFVWATEVASTAGWGVGVDSNDTPLVTGSFSGGVVFDGKVLSASSHEIFVWKHPPP